MTTNREAFEHDRDIAQKAFQDFVTLKPPRWRVECPGPKPPNYGFLSLIQAECERPWVVRSPRGVVRFRTSDRAAALQIGRSMAAIDELLARVARLERGVFGDHPALKASAQARNPVNGIARRAAALAEGNCGSVVPLR